MGLSAEKMDGDGASHDAAEEGAAGAGVTLEELKASPSVGSNWCAGCGRRVARTWKFCIYCGSALGRCPACAAERLNLDGERYCHACGTPL